MSRRVTQEFLDKNFDEESLGSILKAVIEYSDKVFADPDEVSTTSQNEESGPLSDLTAMFYKKVFALLYPRRRESAVARRELALLLYRVVENGYTLRDHIEDLDSLVSDDLGELLALFNADLKAKKIGGAKLIDLGSLQQLYPGKIETIKSDLKCYALIKKADEWMKMSGKNKDVIATIFQQRRLIIASLSARHANTAMQPNITPIAEEMFTSMCAKSLKAFHEGNKGKPIDLWRQYTKDNQCPFSIFNLYETWFSNNDQENATAAQLLEESGLAGNNTNVLWFWWGLAQMKKKDSTVRLEDSVAQHFEKGSGHEYLFLARHVSEECFSKLDAEFRNTIVALLSDSFEGEAHYCSGPLQALLDANEASAANFKDGLSQTTKMARQWDESQCSRVRDLEQDISKLLQTSAKKTRIDLVSRPGFLATQKAPSTTTTTTTTKKRTLRRTVTGIPKSMLLFARSKTAGSQASQESVNTDTCASQRDGAGSEAMEVEARSMSKKRKAVEAAEQDGERPEKKQCLQPSSLG